MSDRFIPLDCNDDVVLLEKDTFKISRLKELAIQKIVYKLNFCSYDLNTKQSGNHLYYFFSSIPIAEESILFNEVQFVSIKDCQLLKLSGKGWQKGKIKIQICWLAPLGDKKIEINLEFCPDEPIASESPLDDIRKMVQAEN
jgi:hypothetical protein